MHDLEEALLYHIQEYKYKPECFCLPVHSFSPPTMWTAAAIKFVNRTIIPGNFFFFFRAPNHTVQSPNILFPSPKKHTKT